MEYKKNDLAEVTITDIGNDGEGIGKIDGYTLFIKDAVIGDTVSAKIMKAKKNYAYAHLEKVLKPSPFRVDAPCPVARQCGGCQIQNLSYEKQLEYKYDKVKNDLLRIGGFSQEEVAAVMEPIVGMDEPFRYRNKAQFPVGCDREGKLISGFYAGRTHSIIPVEDCLLGVKENKEILEAVLSYMRECKVSSYDEVTGKGIVRHVLIRKGFTSEELMVCLVINADKLPRQEVLTEKLQNIKNMVSVSVNINKEKTNVILGKKTETICGSDTIEDTLWEVDPSTFNKTDKGVTYSISPKSFYQVNPVQTQKLYSLALSYAGLTGKESVWDLYCGIGTISLFMAPHAKKVYGVEIVPEAIADAKKNAKKNGFDNAEFFVGKAEEVLPKFYENSADEDMTHPDVIVVDPPRKGCDEVCLNTMLQMKPERIVYVSCDPATLARDLRILVDGGYTLSKVRPVDQFPHTVHVETVVLAEKIGQN
ncbi:MAG: 23S rRNA (uracil(1939)-C(5))-methyltransferase RlmD [Lachnospiraceae bacterium]|nr:23S rRNA (uracil(1939)-C(5))-methyltransferase RlmD [Lachnospiraceae bacterium]